MTPAPATDGTGARLPVHLEQCFSPGVVLARCSMAAQFVELAPALAADLVAALLAWGLRLCTLTREPSSDAQSYVPVRRLLVLLDNCWCWATAGSGRPSRMW
jgi:hypothetical protein